MMLSPSAIKTNISHLNMPAPFLLSPESSEIPQAAATPITREAAGRYKCSSTPLSCYVIRIPNLTAKCKRLSYFFALIPPSPVAKPCGGKVVGLSNQKPLDNK
jgi:hypothetical protein